MKPWTALLPAATLVLALAACGDGRDEGGGGSAAGGGDMSTADACQEWGSFLLDGQPDDYEKIYPAVADKAEELAGEVEDAELSEAFAKAAEANRAAGQAVADGEQPDLEATFAANGGVANACGEMSLR